MCSLNCSCSNVLRLKSSSALRKIYSKGEERTLSLLLILQPSIQATNCYWMKGFRHCPLLLLSAISVSLPMRELRLKLCKKLVWAHKLVSSRARTVSPKLQILTMILDWLLRKPFISSLASFFFFLFPFPLISFSFPLFLPLSSLSPLLFLLLFFPSFFYRSLFSDYSAIIIESIVLMLEI